VTWIMTKIDHYAFVLINFNFATDMFPNVLI